MSSSPRCIELPLPANCVSAVATQWHKQTGFVWLDSANVFTQGQQFSLVSCRPTQVRVHRPEEQSADAFLESWKNAYLAQATQQSSPLPFSGGWLGALYYDFGEELLGIKREARPEGAATAYVAYHPWAVIFDHATNRTFWVDDGQPLDEFATLAQCSLNEVNKDWQARPSETLNRPNWSPLEARCEYEQQVERILEYLLAGDSYQVNYAQPFETKFEGEIWSHYLALRATNAAPFGACLLQTALDDILCFSPELFIKAEGSLLVTQPIKGTTPRHKNPNADARLAEALSKSHKNRAENVMIVDLLRNDLGRICLPGSVQVNSLCELRSYPSVHHLVSEVQGTLPDQKTPIDALKVTFPGGSITGAPKKRSMEIISELERFPRGIYCGSIVALSNNGTFSSNIAIRTISIKGGQARVWGGGGIVADSKPKDEYRETLDKLSKILR